jgi:dephospho-CoA kinase
MIGITGGAGTGKSTVLRYLSEAGYSVASADEIARELRSEPGIRQQIIGALFLPPTSTDSEIRDAVFHSDQKRFALAAVIWPLIWERALAQRCQFFEAPLLVESASMPEFEETWVVTCSREEQVQRLKIRGLDVEQIEALLAIQAPAAAQLAFAAVVIRTNQSEASVKNVALFEAKRALRRKS